MQTDLESAFFAAANVDQPGDECYLCRINFFPGLKSIEIFDPVDLGILFYLI